MKWYTDQETESFPAELCANFQIPNHKTHSVPTVSVIVFKLKAYNYKRIYKHDNEKGCQKNGTQKLNISGTNIKHLTLREKSQK